MVFLRGSPQRILLNRLRHTMFDFSNFTLIKIALFHSYKLVETEQCAMCRQGKTNLGDLFLNFDINYRYFRSCKLMSDSKKTDVNANFSID